MTLIAVKTEQATGDYVEFTRSVYDGHRKTAPVLVNRRLVTHVTEDHKGNVFIHFIGEATVEVLQSLACVMEALER